LSEFLKKLQEKTPIREGTEGYRTILREIYRKGAISIKDLSRSTTIPIPVLAKVVNFLIEKEILDHVAEGSLYTEKGMKFIEQELKFYGYGIASCEKCENVRIFITPRWYELLEELEEILSKRPTVDTTLDQAYATPETTLQRALLAYSRGSIEGKNVCFLGDDDITSVALGNLYKGFYPEEPQLIANEITVFDIDKRLLDVISGVFHSTNKRSLNIKLKQWDYRNSIFLEEINKYDTIFIDPPYTVNGLILTLSRAIDLLKKIPGKEIYLSFAHRPDEELYNIQKLIVEMGLNIQEIIPKFNIYDGAQILGNSTQMLILHTTKHSKSKIPANEQFTKELYTGQIHPSLRLYYCKSCSRIIEVGTNCEFITIENLKEKGCPNCHSNGPFELDEKIET
jgi:N4-bis(aminopropyl)spermidine synthase